MSAAIIEDEMSSTSMMSTPFSRSDITSRVTGRESARVNAVRANACNNTGVNQNRARSVFGRPTRDATVAAGTAACDRTIRHTNSNHTIGTATRNHGSISDHCASTAITPHLRS